MQKTQYGRTLTTVLAIATVANSAYRFGGLVGIAANSEAAGMANELHVEGVYEVVKPVGETWADGAPIYAIGAAGAAVTFTETSAAGRVFVGHVHAHVEGEFVTNYVGKVAAHVRFHGSPLVVA